jgi:sulfite reductase (NADPH) flavoprotein alpha-component
VVVSVSLLKKTPTMPDPPAISELNALAGRLDQQQLWWASGYLAGLAAAAGPAAAGAGEAAAAGAPEAPAQPTWTVFYATETGNCRSIAADLVAQARQAGADAKAVDLADFRPALLKKERRALFVVATHGLGDAPDGTEAFFEFLLADRAPRLAELEYAVLALGDSSYEDFCATGRELDDRLEALGARRLAPRVECDVDFEATSAAWQSGMLERMREQVPPPAAAPAGSATATPQLVPLPAGAPAATAPTDYSRRQPFQAPVLANQVITGHGSSKQVHHVALSLEGSGLSYKPGDSLGVWPTNPPALVAQFLALGQLDPAAEVLLDGERMTLHEALSHRLELTLLGRGMVEDYARQHGLSELLALLTDANRAPLNAWLAQRQVIDVLREHPVEWQPQRLVDALRRVSPRLYSIASGAGRQPGRGARHRGGGALRSVR